MTDVKVGQIWQSNDLRDNGRRFRIKTLGLTGVNVFVANVETGRITRIRKDRLCGTRGKRDYSLIEG